MTDQTNVWVSVEHMDKLNEAINKQVQMVEERDRTIERLEKEVECFRHEAQNAVNLQMIDNKELAEARATIERQRKTQDTAIKEMTKAVVEGARWKRLAKRQQKTIKSLSKSLEELMR